MSKTQILYGALAGWSAAGIVLSISHELGTLWPFSIATIALIGVVAGVVYRTATKGHRQ